MSEPSVYDKNYLDIDAKNEWNKSKKTENINLSFNCYSSIQEVKNNVENNSQNKNSLKKLKFGSKKLKLRPKKKNWFQKSDFVVDAIPKNYNSTKNFRYLKYEVIMLHNVQITENRELFNILIFIYVCGV